MPSRTQVRKLRRKKKDNVIDNKIKDIDKHIFDKNDSLISQTFLFGDEKLSITDKKSILEATIQFLISSARFDPLDILPHWTVFTLELTFPN